MAAGRCTRQEEARYLVQRREIRRRNGYAVRGIGIGMGRAESLSVIFRLICLSKTRDRTRQARPDATAFLGEQSDVRAEEGSAAKSSARTPSWMGVREATCAACSLHKEESGFEVKDDQSLSTRLCMTGSLIRRAGDEPLCASVE